MTYSPLAIICISTGALIYIIMRIVDRYPPKKINKIYGYRTKRSMKSQAHWDFAQEFSSIQMKKGSLGLILLGIVGNFIGLEEGLGAIIATILILVFVLVPVYMTEQELKQKFPEE